MSVQWGWLALPPVSYPFVCLCLFDSVCFPLFHSPTFSHWLSPFASLVNFPSSLHLRNLLNPSFPSPSCRFAYDEDHAKWAITKPSADFTGNTLRVGDQWICIGGINRESTQFRRGGGTVCTMSPQVWSEFNRIISDTEPCP